jgi:DNA-directed RNA polymerase specialized sigma24 family protein
MIGSGDTSYDEAKLLADARRGSLEAFNQLVLVNQEAAWNVAFHLLWNEAAAEKVVQEAVQDLHRGLWMVKRGCFRLQLFSRVVRACQRTLTNGSRNLSPDTLKAGEGAASARLGCLPLPERIVLVLSELEGLAPQEIAEATGAPVPLVRQRLGSALAAALSP